MNSYLCHGCNQLFSTQKSVEYHYSYCIYYNYKKLTSYNYVNNEYIKYIIKILSIISYYDISNDKLIITNILNNNIFKENNIILQNIYNIINNYNVEYISYNELMHIISLCFSITNKELNILIQCYERCTKNLNNLF